RADHEQGPHLQHRPPPSPDEWLRSDPRMTLARTANSPSDSDPKPGLPALRVAEPVDPGDAAREDNRPEQQRRNDARRDLHAYLASRDGAALSDVGSVAACGDRELFDFALWLL